MRSNARSPWRVPAFATPAGKEAPASTPARNEQRSLSRLLSACRVLAIGLAGCVGAAEVAVCSLVVANGGNVPAWLVHLPRGSFSPPDLHLTVPGTSERVAFIPLLVAAVVLIAAVGIVILLVVHRARRRHDSRAPRLPAVEVSPRHTATAERSKDALGIRVLGPAALGTSEFVHRSILVVGVSGEESLVFLKAVSDAGFRVFAADPDTRAVGLRAALKSFALPAPDTTAFVERLREIAHTERVAAICAVGLREVAALAGRGEEFSSSGVASWFPTKQAVDTCLDRWRFLSTLRSVGLQTPNASLGTLDAVPGPWTVRSRYRTPHDRAAPPFIDVADVRAAIAKTASPVVATCPVGRHFAADALVRRDGTIAAAVLRWTGAQDLNSQSDDDAHNSQIAAAIARAVRAIGLGGPITVRGVHVDVDDVVLEEIDPRYSEGLRYSLSSGTNLVALYLDGLLGESPDVDAPSHHFTAVTLAAQSLRDV